VDEFLGGESQAAVEAGVVRAGGFQVGGQSLAVAALECGSEQCGSQALVPGAGADADVGQVVVGSARVSAFEGGGDA
jgi:hypothetical protein